MKKIYLYIWLLLCVGLVSCSDENWFIHTVTYNGKVDKPEMVVTARLEAGKAPTIYVNESVFFLDPNHDELDNVWYMYQGEFSAEHFYRDRHVRSEYLRDAEVRMSVNDAAPILLKGEERLDTVEVNKSTNPQWTISKKYAYTCDHILQPGDKVEVTVSHPRYPKPATTMQYIPYPVNFDIKVEHPDFPNSSTFLAKALVNLESYKGAADNMLCIRTTAYCHQKDSIRQKLYDYSQKKDYYRDTVYVSQRKYSLVYSKDPSFEKYDKTNKPLSSGYYGASAYGLYRGVNIVDEQLPIMVGGTYNENYEHIVGPDEYKYLFYYVDSIVVAVSSITRDDYIYQLSMMAAGYHDIGFIPDYFGTSSGNNFIGDIQDIFDEMGSMEGIQLYCNVDNAIGHVTAGATSTRTFYPDKDFLKH